MTSMLVMILPLDGQAASGVYVGGCHPQHRVGVIRQVQPASSWQDFQGLDRIGPRWLPDSVPDDVPGPATPAEAALLLLALEGHDRQAAAEALFGWQWRKARRSA